jgi:hypothetical protein
VDRIFCAERIGRCSNILFWIQLGQEVTINSASDVTGWTTFTDWTSFVEWPSGDPASDILPRNSLSGFL